MTGSRKKFFQKEWPLAIKLVIICLSLWFIYKQVVMKEDLDKFILLYKNLSLEKKNWLLFLLIDVLMGINWYLEAYKWRLLVYRFEKITLFKSLRATLSGLTVSFFMPNRIGEFAGRVMHLEPDSRIMAVLATIIGSASQLLVTCIFGFFGLAAFLPGYLGLTLGYAVLFWIGAAVLSALFLNMFFHFGFLTRVFHRFRILDRFEKHLAVFEKYSLHELIRILMLSVFRYIIFALQFVLLLRMMGIEQPVVFLFGLVSVVYIVLTLVPTIALTELPLRSSVALTVIGYYSSEHIGILCASFTLWFINLVVPAILGSVCILYFRFTK